MSTDERDETTAIDPDEVERLKTVRANEDSDDVEGHKTSVRANDDAEGDDFEGHSQIRRPSVR
ncbi:MAG: hypothetical protein ABR569_10565 [Gaiellaceae bacterium]